jgi:hypothetical protein
MKEDVVASSADTDGIYKFSVIRNKQSKPSMVTMFSNIQQSFDLKLLMIFFFLLHEVGFVV